MIVLAAFFLAASPCVSAPDVHARAGGFVAPAVDERAGDVHGGRGQGHTHPAPGEVCTARPALHGDGPREVRRSGQTVRLDPAFFYGGGGVGDDPVLYVAPRRTVFITQRPLTLSAGREAARRGLTHR